MKYLQVYSRFFCTLFLRTYLRWRNSRKETALRAKLSFVVLPVINNFVFNSQNYLQIKGCVMATECAPRYLNIDISSYRNNILPAIHKWPFIFLIWSGTADLLMKFKQQINQVHPSIEFHFNFFDKEINSLDTLV